MSRGARSTDPITSWLGAADVEGRKLNQQTKMLGAYAGAFPEGLTNTEAAEVAGLASGRTCYWKRSSELLAAGFIEEVKTGSGAIVTRFMEDTKSVQRVCRITDDGWSELRRVIGR